MCLRQRMSRKAYLQRIRREARITEITERLKRLLPDVLKVTGIESQQSLHGIYGHLHPNFIDLKHEVINTPEHFISLWQQGLMRTLEDLGDNAKASYHYRNFLWLRDYEVVREYVFLFLERTYYRNYEALSKKRPTPEESTIWIGQERATYGLLVTPRFRNGNWENDKSEIRHFKKNYWSIGHILQTGLVIPFEDDKVEFPSLNHYLTFFRSVLVRASGSPHEREVARRYCDFVRNSSDPENIPLLIPELRYGGLAKNHQYRLDFCVINPYDLSKVGFELSPWSTHGRLTKLTGKTQAEVNKLAQSNFEEEMKKQKSFFRKFGIFIQIFTDADLADPDAVFEQIKLFLTPEKAAAQLHLGILEDFLAFDI